MPAPKLIDLLTVFLHDPDGPSSSSTIIHASILELRAFHAHGEVISRLTWRILYVKCQQVQKPRKTVWSRAINSVNTTNIGVLRQKASLQVNLKHEGGFEEESSEDVESVKVVWNWSYDWIIPFLRDVKLVVATLSRKHIA